MNSASNVVLNDLLDDELSFDATTKSGLTNHLPMALVAKAGLGAGPDELARFVTTYRRRLVPIEVPNDEFTGVTWRHAIGEPNAYPELLGYFNREVTDNGVEATLHTHLKYLIDGVSGAGFHGVIRLAYALEVDAPLRVSAGLAYFAASAMTLGPLESGPATSDSPEELFSDLAGDPQWDSLESVRMISARMRLVASRPEFAQVASSLVVGEHTSRQLADVALQVYASTNDFTALHGVTGLEAIARLRPFVDDVDRLDRASFQALAAAYLTIGAPSLWSSDRLDEMVATTTLDATAVAGRAAGSNDEHVAKIVYSATRLGEETGNRLYLSVAERAVKEDDSVESSQRENDVIC
jgi:hypothetical protein